MKKQIIAQGAEAIIYKLGKKIVKDRIKKSYRLSELDEKIRRRRTKAEAKILTKASKIINVPKLLAEPGSGKIIHMEFIDGQRLSESLDSFSLKQQKEILKQIGKDISKLHDEGLIHGDLTTSNMIYVEKEKKVFFIDFGLGFHSKKYEDKAVDIHLLRQALEAKHFKNWEQTYKSFLEEYNQNSDSEKTINQLAKVEKRGRYKH
jgi:TP53 regulating kinase and related kinases